MDNVLTAAYPLDPAPFAALMAPFAPFGERVGVAVSGGPDSMALALCVSRWKPNPLALIVDHALRPEASDEARQTQERLKNLGLESEILRWDHPPILSRLHKEARQARYRLLIEACHRHGIHDLLFAHHRDDQAETILMRFAKGSGIEGLAGMRPSRTESDVRILRPFLSLPKESLVATCRAEKIPFITDPSNDSEKFARGRLRKVMTLLKSEGLTVERLLDMGARAAEAQDALDHATQVFLTTFTRRDDAGVLFFQRDSFAHLPKAIALQALRLALHHLHAKSYAPERAALVSVYEKFCRKDFMPCTLHGCLISRSATEIRLMREPAAITESLSVRSGETVLWDQRWLVRSALPLNSSPSSREGTEKKNAPVDRSLTLRALGHTPHAVLDKIAPALRHRIPQGRIRASLPSLWEGETLVAIPSLTASLQKPWPPESA